MGWSVRRPALRENGPDLGMPVMRASHPGGARV